MRRIVIFATLLIFVASGAVLAERWEKISRNITADGAEKIIINADLGSGEFRITSGNISQVAKIEVEYDTRKVESSIEYEVKRSAGILTLESESRKKSNIDTEDNIWEIVLSKNYDTELNIDIGACEAKFDLGGIRLSHLEFDVGAAESKFDFSEPNPIRLHEINIDAGASSLEMINIGNANFDEFKFSGGVGSFELDFRGKYKGESIIEIEIGLGSAEIILPEGIPVRVETEGGNWLSSIDFHNEDLDKVDDDLYESPDFKGADTRIVISLEVGLGSIDLFWK